jgi:hypothetical protein
MCQYAELLGQKSWLVLLVLLVLYFVGFVTLLSALEAEDCCPLDVTL